MKDQMKLVPLTDKERLELGSKAAKLGERLEALRAEFAEVKKDFTDRIDGTLTLLMETLHALNE